jgi:TRAP-type C4-dicarboxylate transport system permease large subunit
MVNLGIGLVTPPVGTVLFVGCAVGNVKMEDTVRTIWPFYLVMLVTLLLVTYIPAISMFIPNLLMG